MSRCQWNILSVYCAFFIILFLFKVFDKIFFIQIQKLETCYPDLIHTFCKHVQELILLCVELWEYKSDTRNVKYNIHLILPKLCIPAFKVMQIIDTKYSAPTNWQVVEDEDKSTQIVCTFHFEVTQNKTSPFTVPNSTYQVYVRCPLISIISFTLLVFFILIILKKDQICLPHFDCCGFSIKQDIPLQFCNVLCSC